MTEDKNLPGPEQPAPEEAVVPPAVAEEEMDAATASLAKALRFSFLLLKLVMLVLIVVYAVSGFYHVRQDEVALELRFGRVVGVGEDRIKSPGQWRFAWPTPIGEVVRIPTSARSLDVNTFWPRISDMELEEGLERGEARRRRAYADAQDRYVMTGDMTRVRRHAEDGVEVEGREPAPNLVQARFSIHFRVPPGAAETYFMNVMDESDERRCQDLVRDVLEASIVEMVSGLEVYDVLRDRVGVGALLREKVQRSLDAIPAGIMVTSVSMSEMSPPRTVASSFDEVSSADQDYSSRIRQAEGYRNDVLSQAAGGQGMSLHNALKELWEAQTEYLRARIERDELVAADEAAPWSEEELQEWSVLLDEKEQTVRGLFRHPETGDLRVQGEAASILRRAESDRDRLVSRARGAADVALALLDQYRDDADGEAKLLNYLRHRRLEVVADVFNRAEEKFFMSANHGRQRELRLLLSRDPAALRARERVRDVR